MCHCGDLASWFVSPEVVRTARCRGVSRVPGMTFRPEFCLSIWLASLLLLFLLHDILLATSKAMDCILSVLKNTHERISYARKPSIAYPFLISSSMLHKSGHTTRSVLLSDGFAITEHMKFVA